MAIQTVDFAEFLHGENISRGKAAHEIVESLRDHGFVKLINHGIPENTVKDYLKGTKQLFNLSLEAKAKFENIKGPKPQRGWSSKGAEVTAKLYGPNMQNGITGDELKDEREFFDAGPPDDAEYPNKWPATEDLHGFEKLMNDCYLRLQKSSLQIIEAIEVGLDLPAGTLVQRCIPAHSEIRLNHYPAIRLKDLNGKTKRTWPHTDFGIITLLFQDTVGGLELEDRKNPGNFVPVPPGREDRPTELVVNISDTFERWTNGTIRAGVHRVDVPRGLKDTKDLDAVCPDRYSSIFFFKATRETSVGPLPAFVSPERPAKFDDITALEFQKRKTSVLY